MKAILLGILVLISACSMEIASATCEDWTWIDHESCSVDICNFEDSEYECREGVCWCCFDGECWEE